MSSDAVARYFAAAGVQSLPADLHTLRPPPLPEGHLDEIRLRTDLATDIWCASDTTKDRLAALEDLPDGVEQTWVRQAIRRALANHHQLGCEEIEFALRRHGVGHADDNLLTDAERQALDRDGFVDLGCLLDEPALEAIRIRADARVEQEGTAAGGEVSRMPGIGRVSGTVLKSMNHDGLFDVFFEHPRLLAAVRHVLGSGFKMSSSNFHCPLPGYGHQCIHADWGWGVRQPEVVNAIWMLDDFTLENGPTRVVPGSHRSGAHPSGSMLNQPGRTPYDPVDGERFLTGPAGHCVVYNAHLWHGGTQNRSPRLRRALHSYFTRSARPPQTNAPELLHASVGKRLDRAQRAILDLPPLAGAAE